jgi:hypothetical protein
MIIIILKLRFSKSLSKKILREAQMGRVPRTGGAWTEETFDPDKGVWYPPEYRDINLGFRCVCDWDKIMEVKEPGKLSRKPAIEEDEQGKIEID